MLGIGRGDSALAHLGLSPAPVEVFERYLMHLQAYLRGDAIDLGAASAHAAGAADVATLGLAGGPENSRIHWLPGTQPKVPVDVAATGPKVIAAAARHADSVTFAVGADPDRLRSAIATARKARQAAGHGPDRGAGGLGALRRRGAPGPSRRLTERR